MEVQPGDDRMAPFSFETDTPPENKVVCHITYTNAATKQVILDNLDRSPMYSGKIEGKGPRYCPSFEDKVVRFSDREQHQLFVEPCGEKDGRNVPAKGCPPPCRRMCSWRLSTPFPVWSTPR